MVPQAFPMFCLMYQTFSAVTEGSATTSSFASDLAVGGYSSRTAPTGCGIMSRAQSSVEKTSTNSHTEVSYPSFRMYELIRTGFDSSGNHFFVVFFFVFVETSSPVALPSGVVAVSVVVGGVGSDIRVVCRRMLSARKRIGIDSK